jgi:hypothetical protein
LFTLAALGQVSAVDPTARDDAEFLLFDLA